MQIGIIGLGKMGYRIAEKILADGHTLSVWNRSTDIVETFQQNAIDKQLSGKLTTTKSVEELVQSLESPRVVWLMLPAGEATQTTLDEVSQHIEKGDIIIDGGNANWKDTQRRYDECSAKGICYLGIGVSGGIKAFDNGFPMMAGGDQSAYETITPILDTLSRPNGGHTYFGTGGVGHFIKMVHNGIEYGYMQALGEGMGVLASAPYAIDLLQAAKLWQKGTIIDSFLVDRAADALGKNAKLDDIEGVIAESGEAKWTVEAAKEEHVPIEIIEKSLEFRQKSQTDEIIQKSFAARMVASLRREFGGHAVKEK